MFISIAGSAQQFHHQSFSLSPSAQHTQAIGTWQQVPFQAINLKQRGLIQAMAQQGVIGTLMAFQIHY